MYNKIVNPITNRKVDINSKLGQNILNNYLYSLRGGSGSFRGSRTGDSPDTNAASRTNRYGEDSQPPASRPYGAFIFPPSGPSQPKQSFTEPPGPKVGRAGEKYPMPKPTRVTSLVIDEKKDDAAKKEDAPKKKAPSRSRKPSSTPGRSLRGGSGSDRRSSTGYGSDRRSSTGYSSATNAPGKSWFGDSGSEKSFSSMPSTPGSTPKLSEEDRKRQKAAKEKDDAAAKKRAEEAAKKKAAEESKKNETPKKIYPYGNPNWHQQGRGHYM